MDFRYALLYKLTSYESDGSKGRFDGLKLFLFDSLGTLRAIKINREFLLGSFGYFHDLPRLKFHAHILLIESVVIWSEFDQNMKRHWYIW